MEQTGTGGKRDRRKKLGQARAFSTAHGRDTSPSRSPRPSVKRDARPSVRRRTEVIDSDEERELTRTHAAYQKLDGDKLDMLKSRFKAAAYDGKKGVQIRQLFNKIDKDDSGCLDEEEFRKAVRKKLRISDDDITDKEVADIWAALDEDGSGEVDVAEVLNFLDPPEAEQSEEERDDGHGTVGEAADSETHETVAEEANTDRMAAELQAAKLEVEDLQAAEQRFVQEMQVHLATIADGEEAARRAINEGAQRAELMQREICQLEDAATRAAESDFQSRASAEAALEKGRGLEEEIVDRCEKLNESHAELITSRNECEELGQQCAGLSEKAKYAYAQHEMSRQEYLERQEAFGLTEKQLSDSFSIWEKKEQEYFDTMFRAREEDACKKENTLEEANHTQRELFRSEYFETIEELRQSEEKLSNALVAEEKSQESASKASDIRSEDACREKELLEEVRNLKGEHKASSENLAVVKLKEEEECAIVDVIRDESQNKDQELGEFRAHSDHMAEKLKECESAKDEIHESEVRQHSEQSGRLQSARSECEHLQDQCAQLMEKLRGSAESLDEIRSLKEECEQLSERCVSLSSKEQEQNANSKSVQIEAEHKDLELEKFRAQSDDMVKRLKECESARDELHESEQKKCSEQSGQLHSARLECEHLQDQCAQLKEKSFASFESLAETRSIRDECDTLTQRCLSLSNKEEEEYANNKSIRVEAQHQNLQLEQCRDQVTDLASRLKDSESTSDKVHKSEERTLCEQAGELQRARLECEELQGQCAHLTAKDLDLTEPLAEIQILKEENKVLINRSDALFRMELVDTTWKLNKSECENQQLRKIEEWTRSVQSRELQAERLEVEELHDRWAQMQEKELESADDCQRNYQNLEKVPQTGEDLTRQELSLEELQHFEAECGHLSERCTNMAEKEAQLVAISAKLQVDCQQKEVVEQHSAEKLPRVEAEFQQLREEYENLAHRESVDSVQAPPDLADFQPPTVAQKEFAASHSAVREARQELDEHILRELLERDLHEELQDARAECEELRVRCSKLEVLEATSSLRNERMPLELSSLVDEEQQQDGSPRIQTYLVDNSVLRSVHQGLGYRHSKTLDDKDETRTATWGTRVQGIDEGDGWLRLPGRFVSHDRYLPMTMQGKRVLILAKDDVPTNNTESPSSPAWRQPRLRKSMSNTVAMQREAMTPSPRPRSSDRSRSVLSPHGDFGDEFLCGPTRFVPRPVPDEMRGAQWRRQVGSSRDDVG